MGKTASLCNTNLPPLADRVRPITLTGFIGQNHLVGKNKIIYKMVSQGKPFSMILWGPPGSGKTTLARIIAKSTDAKMAEISAVSSGVKDIRNIIDQGKANYDTGINTILFIDEIHRFSKSQQDALLHAVEEGLITLIGATTENPSFEVISPLLSRCRTLILNPLSEDALEAILEQRFKTDVLLSDNNIRLDESIRKKLVYSAGGDASKMLNTFDSSQRIGQEPLRFTLGVGQVIDGWDQGIIGMKVSGQRKLKIPPELGYGSQDKGVIPPNSTLIFKVELLEVE